MHSRRRFFYLGGLAVLILSALMVNNQTGLSQSETPQVFMPIIRRDATQTPTPTVTATATATATSTPTATPTNTPTITATPTFPPAAWFPLIRKDLPPAPQYVTSYYIQDESGGAVYNLGCALGVRDATLAGKQDSLVILDFGQMWIDASDTYGVASFSPYWHFISLATVESAVKQYVIGYWNCSRGDTISQVTLGVGVNSFGSYGTGNYDTNYLKTLASIFGSKIANSVYTLNTWAVQNGYASQVNISAAIDIEWACDNLDPAALSNKWNHPDVVFKWIEGFTTQATHNEIYFNFGACVGCPTSPIPSWTYTCSAKPQPWNQDKIWYVSWGAPPAFAVPEIYSNNSTLAKQWQAVSKFGALYKGTYGRIDFSGPMTQWQACQTRPENECLTLDNTPEEGWQQLYTEINKDPLTAQEILLWVTDIDWQIK